MPVLVGDDLLGTDARRLRRAVEIAEDASGLRFEVVVGHAEDDARADALARHAALDDPAHAVLVLCDRDAGVLEIVTGATARRALSDRDCALAAASMRSSFVAGDIVGGLSHGVTQLGESARQPPSLHTRTEDD